MAMTISRYAILQILVYIYICCLLSDGMRSPLIMGFCMNIYAWNLCYRQVSFDILE